MGWYYIFADMPICQYWPLPIPPILDRAASKLSNFYWLPILKKVPICWYFRYRYRYWPIPNPNALCSLRCCASCFSKKHMFNCILQTHPSRRCSLQRSLVTEGAACRGHWLQKVQPAEVTGLRRRSLQRSRVTPEYYFTFGHCIFQTPPSRRCSLQTSLVIPEYSQLSSAHLLLSQPSSYYCYYMTGYTSAL